MEVHCAPELIPEFMKSSVDIANGGPYGAGSRDSADHVSCIMRGLISVTGVFESPGHRLDIGGLDDVLARVHAPDYLRFLRGGTPWLNGGSGSRYGRSLASAATARCAARSLMANRERVSYALCSPPGHHAAHSFAAGESLLNNAAVAALELVSAGARRPVVLDLDFYPGNGTSDVLAHHPETGFASLHSRTSANLPWMENLAPKHPGHLYIDFGTPPTIPIYLQQLSDLLISDWLEGADVIVLSLGYNLIEGDPEGDWDLPPVIFQEIGALVASIGLPICVIQEGGSHSGMLEECARQFATGIASELQYNKRQSA